MEAPDKIYVSRNFSKDNSPHGLWYLNKSEHDINVEYIRKDALLKWAENKIAKGTIDEWDKGYVQCLNDLIDKLNSI